jgi:DUF1365 family protein
MRPAALLLGKTTHTREKPFRRSFSHRIAMIEVDIDRLAEAAEGLRLFAINRAAAVSFRETDHGARSASVSLRLWAEGQFASAGVTLDGGQIRLAIFPRVLGYGFAPISIWFGHGPDGALRGVIYEVHNTFGETHAYVSAFNPDERPTAPKEFHVSPFFDVSGDYRFSLRPGEGEAPMMLTVENIGADGRVHVASLTVRRQALSDAAILRWLVSMPLSGLGVLLAIHWQALILWIKGAAYHEKPGQRAERTTIVAARGTAATAERPRKRA